MNNPSKNVVRSWDVLCQRLFAQNQFAIKLGLENMREALAVEGKRLHVNLLASHPAILVAGTNGKGSTAAFISAILQAHGLRVGLYTSPHLIDFRERFRVNGQLLPEGQVERIGNEVIKYYGGGRENNPCLTFFELTTMMAIRLFHEENIDVGVYEIGLGGRLDAVNVLEPSVSVITSIDFDHGQFLGTTLEEIAREKCGIFREDNVAVVGFQQHPQVMRKIEELAPVNTVFYGRDFGGLRETSAIGSKEVIRTTSKVMQYNAQTAVEASRSYLGGLFDSEKVVLGLSCMRWPGRMDLREVPLIIHGKTTVKIQYLLDAAHNEASVEALFSHLTQNLIKVGAVVLGAMADKSLGAMFARLGELGVPVFGVEIANQRAASAEQLRVAVMSAEQNGAEQLWQGAGPCDWALKAAGYEVGKSGLTVLVFGSIYLLGEFFEWAGIETESMVTYDEMGVAELV